MADQAEREDFVEEAAEESAEEVVSQDVQLSDDSGDVEPATEEGAEPLGETPEEAYERNLTYKVYDEERTLPDWTHELITDKEREDLFRQLFSQADAFDPMKEKYQSTRSEYESLNQNHTKMIEQINELDYYMQNDLGAFFDKLNIPNDRLIKYVKDQLAYEDMGPEQRAAADRARQATIQQYEHQSQTQRLQQENERLITQQLENEYATAVAMPEVSSFVKSFEERTGPGSFRNYVSSEIQSEFLKSGVELRPLEAVKKVMEAYKPLFGTVGAPENPVADLAQEKAARRANKPGGTIPNVGSAEPVSPTKPVFKSIKDLKEYYKQNYEQQA